MDCGWVKAWPQFLNRSQRIVDTVDELLEKAPLLLLRHLCEHLAALCWFQTDPKTGETRACMASGFFLLTKGTLFWVTAGHVLTGLQGCFENGYEPRGFRFWHGWQGGQSEVLTPIPVEQLMLLPCDVQDLGLDVGAIPIPTHWARLLARAGVNPLRRSDWGRQKDRFDQYVLLGFPTDARTFRTRHTGSIIDVDATAGTPLLRLRHTDSPPACLVKPCHRIYAEVEALEWACDGKTVRCESIDGMSGGPLFGLQDTERGPEWRLVGVQGSWAAESKIIAACPIRPFATAIAQKFESACNEVMVVPTPSE